MQVLSPGIDPRYTLSDMTLSTLGLGEGEKGEGGLEGGSDMNVKKVLKSPFLFEFVDRHEYHLTVREMDSDKPRIRILSLDANFGTYGFQRSGVSLILFNN